MLCQTAIVYSRKIKDETLSFGHEGVLFKKSFIMYDKKTRTLWLHTTGRAIKGKRKGDQLTFFPSRVMTWADWKKQYPKTKVLTGPKGSRFMGHFGLRDKPRAYGWVLGQGDTTKMYPYGVLQRAPFLQDQFGGRAVVIHLDKEMMSATAFAAGKRRFMLKNKQVIDQDGLVWFLATGRSADGKHALDPIAITPWLQQRWRGFYPKGDVYPAKPLR